MLEEIAKKGAKNDDDTDSDDTQSTDTTKSTQSIGKKSKQSNTLDIENRQLLIESSLKVFYDRFPNINLEQKKVIRFIYNSSSTAYELESRMTRAKWPVTVNLFKAIKCIKKARFDQSQIYLSSWIESLSCASQNDHSDAQPHSRKDTSSKNKNKSNTNKHVETRNMPDSSSDEESEMRRPLFNEKPLSNPTLGKISDSKKK